MGSGHPIPLSGPNATRKSKAGLSSVQVRPHRIGGQGEYEKLFNPLTT